MNLLFEAGNFTINVQYCSIIYHKKKSCADFMLCEIWYCLDEAEDPALTPVSWVSKWVDYSDKYGLGYQLSDGSVGVLFNDATRLLMHEDEKYALF